MFEDPRQHEIEPFPAGLFLGFTSFTAGKRLDQPSRLLPLVQGQRAQPARAQGPAPVQAFSNANSTGAPGSSHSCSRPKRTSRPSSTRPVRRLTLLVDQVPGSTSGTVATPSESALQLW